MVRKRSAVETPFLDNPVIPTLQPMVKADQLSGDHPGPDIESRSTDGRFLFEDYSVGECIDHVDGTTINSSDHMSFTRLYQNSARVHFDAIITGGKPLVYGGLVLSIGYAQAFNGMEQRLGLRAINSGSHANPVYSGDTLYSLTRVVDKQELSKGGGALRLQLLVLKNERPPAGFEPHMVDPATGKKRYHRNVVLDLDYWELIARRSSDAS